MSFKKIFVPLDDSELSHRVFSQALELARIDRAQVMLFNCVTINSLGETAMPIPVDLGMNSESSLSSSTFAAGKPGKTGFWFAEKLLRRRSQTRIAGGI
jgi:nucleotide-binding universal stress UspA family protein